MHNINFISYWLNYFISLCRRTIMVINQNWVLLLFLMKKRLLSNYFDVLWNLLQFWDEICGTLSRESHEEEQNCRIIFLLLVHWNTCQGGWFKSGPIKGILKRFLVLLPLEFLFLLEIIEDDGDQLIKSKTDQFDYLGVWLFDGNGFIEYILIELIWSRQFELF